MGKGAETILKEISLLSKEADREKWAKAAEDLCGDAYKVTGNKGLLDTSIPVHSRIGMAQRECAKSLNKTPVALPITTGKPEPLRVDTVNDIQRILHDPNLSDEELEAVLDATFFIHEADDKLNPGDIENDVKQRKQYSDNTSLKKDILAERKKRTEEFLSSEKSRLDKKRFFKEKSNTKGDLRELEKTVHYVSTAKNLDDEGKKKAFGAISTGVASVGSAIAVGDGLGLYKEGAKFLASKTAKTLIKAGVMKVAEKAGINFALKGIGTALAGPIGTVIATLLTTLGGKFLEKGIKYGVGALAGLAVAGILAVPGMIVMVIAGIIAFIGVITMAAALTVGAAFAVFMIFSAFALFVINSGAYIVPPAQQLNVSDTTNGQDNATFGGGGETDFIRIVKTPSPPGPFAVAGTSISYTIEIQAKVSTLTNVRFLYNCYVSFSSLPCPAITPEIPSPPKEIKPGEPFVIRYTSNYPTSYNNSVVVDSLRVTADVPDQGLTNHVASGFAAVRFGEPNTRCLRFDNTWLPASKNVMYVAIAQLMQERRYIDGLCSGPDITLTRQLYDPGYGGITNQFNITFYNQAFNNGVKSAYYTLAHESAHAYAHVNPGTFVHYVATVPLPTTDGGYICTYPSSGRTGTKQNKINENFAEAAALFALSRSASSSTVNLSCLGGKSFGSVYPTYYAFLKNYMF